uniref:Latexin n=1 Tax=Paramormyrops kingsleyae TaxID=1676925 RepID=A0A3B3RMN5_9TELE|nr:latexin isoform X1 [Paramormyrops kingsleyae]
MFWCFCAVLVLAAPSPAQGSPTAASSGKPARGTDMLAAAGRLTQSIQKGSQISLTSPSSGIPEEAAMPVKDLNPAHYPARRAAIVAQHFLNTQHSSPCKLFLLDAISSATLQETEEKGNKYKLEFSLKDAVSNQSVGPCSAEVQFPSRGEEGAPLVQYSCQGLSAVNTTDQEESFYRRLRDSGSLVTANDIPDSYGHMAPEMKPLWRLGAAAASFIMLKESNESTLYNVAQVTNIMQQESEGDQLKFRYHILLHDMVSQEIIPWVLLFTWSPAEGVRVLSAEKQPRCPHGTASS